MDSLFGDLKVARIDKIDDIPSHLQQVGTLPYSHVSRNLMINDK
jgi:hypothetical protein